MLEERMKHLIVPDKYSDSFLLLHPSFEIKNYPNYCYIQAYRVSFNTKINAHPTVIIPGLLFSNKFSYEYYDDWRAKIKNKYIITLDLGNLDPLFYEKIYNNFKKREKKYKEEFYLPELNSIEMTILKTDKQIIIREL